MSAGSSIACRSRAMLVATIVSLGIISPSAAQEDGETRASASRYYDKGGRALTSLAATTVDHYDALQTEGARERPGRQASGERSSPGVAEAKLSSDFWIYDADVQLFNDDDRDGYFHGIDVLIDADTLYEVADVYAALYLSYEGGPWNEYAVTETFSIFGATSDDEYVVVTELMSGYPSGEYDLLIELYDTWDGSFVAELGPADDSGLGYLPLEDFRRDEPRRSHGHKRGGGGLDLWLLLLLAGTAAGFRAGLIRWP